MSEPVDPQQPVADVLEQRQDVGSADPADIAPGLPPEADPGDVAEQQRDLGDFDDEEEGPDHG
ncbi:MAG TPA: hypothetical protein VHC18_05140 [Amycolatopsis sp.]|nr:hypothetical protein [Amycolatopsis sp.]